MKPNVLIGKGGGRGRDRGRRERRIEEKGEWGLLLTGSKGRADGGWIEETLLTK